MNFMSTQMNNIVTQMNQQMSVQAHNIQQLMNQRNNLDNNNNYESSNGNDNGNHNNGNDGLISTPPIVNQFRLPSLSTNNKVLIKNGKFVNFDHLLPGSLAHASSGYSLHFNNHLSNSGSGVENDSPLSLQPNAGRRTIRSFTSWLSAWNIFSQSFCHFFPSFAGLLAAYQSQIAIYANRYEFISWSTYDRLFRQNMANTHPNSDWGNVDRHLFDEVLLCAPVLAVCYICREPGHYHSSCPSRGGQLGLDTQPFRAPQRTSNPTQFQPRSSTSTTTSRMLRPNHANSHSPACRYYNAGSCTFHACTFAHQCSICKGNHPASKHDQSK